MNEIEDDRRIEQTGIHAETSAVCVVNDELPNDGEISYIIVPEGMLFALKDSGYEIPNLLLQNSSDLALERSSENEILQNSYLEVNRARGNISEQSSELELQHLTRTSEIASSTKSCPPSQSSSLLLSTENVQNASFAEYSSVTESLRKLSPCISDNTSVVYTLSVNPTCSANNLETSSNSIVDCVSINCDAPIVSCQNRSIPLQRTKKRKLINSDKKSKNGKLFALTSSSGSTLPSTSSKEPSTQSNNCTTIRLKGDKIATLSKSSDINSKEILTSDLELGGPSIDQTKPKPYKCHHLDCPQSFRTGLKLKRHLRFHGQSAQQRSKIPRSNNICDEHLPTTSERGKSTVSNNLETQNFGHDYEVLRTDLVNIDNKETYKCNYPDCEQEFTLKSKLQTHQKMHASHKSYPSPIANCINAFLKQENSKCHSKVHPCKAAKSKEEESSSNSIECPDDSLIYYLCPYDGCGTLCNTITDAKQHVLKHHSNTAYQSNEVTEIEPNTLPISLQPLFNESAECSLISQECISLPESSKCSSVLSCQVLTCTDSPANNTLTNSSFASDESVSTTSHQTSSSDGKSNILSGGIGLMLTSNEKILKTKIRNSSNLPAFSNKESGKQIVNAAAVTSKEHKGKQLFKCGVMNCNKAFASESDLNSHMADHAKPEIHKCTYPNCPWSFKTPYKLKRHLTSHEQKKQYNCKFPGCNKVCSTSYNLQAHYKRHFEDNQLTCSICNENFPNKHKLHKHIRDTHNPEPLFCCEYKNCGRKFHSSAALTTHHNSHITKKLQLVCTEPGCNNKVFKKNCLYQEHLMTHHAGVKPYKCDFPGCKWAFPNRSKLRRHKMTHNTTKRYFCPVATCKSAFHRLEHLKNHVRVHTCNGKEAKEAEENPSLPIESSEDDLVYYLCPYEECGSLFTTLIGAKQHIQKLHSSNSKPSGEEPNSEALNAPVSITLEAMAKADTKPTVSDNSIAVMVNSDTMQQNEENSKSDSTTSKKGNISSLLSTMLQSQSCERPSEDILINTKSLDSVSQVTGQDIQFAGLQSSDTSYTSGVNLDLDNVANFTLTVQDSMPIRLDPSQYLLGTSGDFVTTSRPISEPIDFITLQQQCAYTASSSADQFLNFSECHPSVDPNIIMPVPISVNQPTTSKVLTLINLENTDEEDGAATADDCNNNVGMGGSARTDCDAYRRACLGKKISKSAVSTTLLMSPKQVFLDESRSDEIDETSATVAERFSQKAVTLSSHLESAFNSFMITDMSKRTGIPDLAEGMVQLTPSKDSYYEVGSLMNDAVSHKEQFKNGELESLRDCARDFAGSTINLNDLA